MNEPITEARVRQIIEEVKLRDQSRVAKVIYHLHNGVDSPNVPYGSLSENPNYFCVATNTNGTSPANVFGPGGAPFNATLTGMFVISLDTTAANISAYNSSKTVATIVKGTTAGLMTGATSLSNVTYVRGSTMTVASSSAGNSTVFLTFTA